MIRRFYLITSLFLIALTSFCQELKVDVVYYDGTTIPYKIERKYFNKNDSSSLYIRYTDDYTIYIKRKEYKHQDTTIIMEEYGRLSGKKSKLELIAESDSQTMSIFDSKDSLLVTFYKEGSLIGDTLLIGEATIANIDIAYKIESEKISLILDNKIIPAIDSLTKQETVKSYYLHNKPVKCEWLSANDEVYTTTYISYFKNYIVCNKYRPDKNSTPKLFRVDSITWNKSPSEKTWKTTRIDWGMDFEGKFIFKGKRLQMLKGDSLLKTIYYYHTKDLLRMLILNNTIYDDPLYSFEYLQFERVKELKTVFPNGVYVKNIFSLDSEKRITEKRKYRNKMMVGRVTYKYD